MVSTRRSARKPPNPSRPPSATSVITPVVDDPPPPYPRRSPRIRIKNGENLPFQFISLTPSSTTTTRPVSSNQAMPLTQQSHLYEQLPTINTLDESLDRTLLAPENMRNKTTTRDQMSSQDHKQAVDVSVDSIPTGASLPGDQGTRATENRMDCEESTIRIGDVEGTAVPEMERQVRSLADHRAESLSNDDGPEEITAADAKREVEESGRVERFAQIAIRREIKKRRNRYRRKEVSIGPLQSDVLQCDADQQYDADRDVFVAERLPHEAIVAVQSAIEKADIQRAAATETALLKKQVKKVASVNRPHRVGNVEVTVVANTFPPASRILKKGRQSATSFLTSCIQNGPKRVPSSKIAMKAASAKSLRI